MTLWQGGKVPRAAQQLDHESTRLRAGAGQTGTLSNQLTAYQSPGVSYRVVLAPSVPLCRDAPS